MSRDKNCPLGVSTCRATSFKCLRHIHLSWRQTTTSKYDVKTLFSIIFWTELELVLSHSLWRYIIKLFAAQIVKTLCILFHFYIELWAAGEWLCEVWLWLLRHFYVQNVIEHRFLWNMCFIIYRTNASAQHNATCHNSSQAVNLKMSLLQYLWVLQSWYNVTFIQQQSYVVCRATDTVDLPCVLSCCATWFECLRHVHLSLRQGTTCPSMTSKSFSLSCILNIAKTSTFQYIQSEGMLY